MRNPGYMLIVAAVLALLSLDAKCAAQGFPTVGSTNIKERVAGAVLLADGVAPVEIGDQVGMFAGGEIVGSFTWTGSDNTEEFAVVVYGDIPETPDVEGPTNRQVVVAKFYDSSTDTIREDVRLENAQGEGVTYRYTGEDVPPLPIDLPGLDLTPTRALNLHIGVQADSNSGTGGDSGAGSNPDVDGDGRVTTRDAALVLRIVTGRGAGVSQDTISRADVNGDGTVSTDDAIAIMRSR